jgi:hypothetical protein
MPFVPDTVDNEQRCNCPGCPSNPLPDAVLWCAREAHTEPVEERGCLCPQCPIFKVYNLSGEYYCIASIA